jgi:hypothetical protein
MQPYTRFYFRKTEIFLRETLDRISEGRARRANHQLLGTGTGTTTNEGFEILDSVK